MKNLREKYWDHRYSGRRSSGVGSIGDRRNWKWEIIDQYIPNINQVIDVGCGDLSFWESRDCEDYVGIDVSQVILERNRILRPSWTFIRSDAQEKIMELKRGVVFCFDLLFHIMTDDGFERVLRNLCQYSLNFIFIYTWKNNPFTPSIQMSRLLHNLRHPSFSEILEAMKNFIVSRPNKVTDGKYQYFRKLDDHLEIFHENNFELCETFEYRDKIGAMYILQKKTHVNARARK